MVEGGKRDRERDDDRELKKIKKLFLLIVFPFSAVPVLFLSFPLSDTRSLHFCMSNCPPCSRITASKADSFILNFESHRATAGGNSDGQPRKLRERKRKEKQQCGDQKNADPPPPSGRVRCKRTAIVRLPLLPPAVGEGGQEGKRERRKREREREEERAALFFLPGSSGGKKSEGQRFD